jgi:hypothetical protein
MTLVERFYQHCHSGNQRFQALGIFLFQGGIKMEEKRGIGRVGYPAKGVVVVCDTQEKIFVNVKDVSPLGMGIVMDADAPDINGKDIIIVAETLIMYANVNRQEKQEDGTYIVGIEAKRFTQDYLSISALVKKKIKKIYVSAFIFL